MRHFTLPLAIVLALTLSMRAKEVSKIPPLPTAVCSFGAAVSDGWVYIYGGHCGKPHTYSTEDVVGTFHRLKLQGGKQWEKLPGGPSLQGLTLVSHKGKLYRIGGMQPRNKVGERPDNNSLKACVCFDPAIGKWENLPDLPEPRSSHGAVVVGDTIYVFGGWTMLGKAEGREWLSHGVKLDLSKKDLKWEKINQPFQRRALSVTALGNKVYIMGGLSKGGGLARTVDIFDIQKQSWSNGPDIPSGRMTGFSPASCVTGGHVYVSTANGAVYRLTHTDNAWREVAQLEKARIVHQMLPLTDSSLLVLGGATRGSNVAENETIETGKGKSKLQSNRWPGFRGDGTNTINATELPIKWSSDKITWETKLSGYGQSSPVVWGNRVFLTATEGPNKEKCVIAAYDVSTGKSLWAKQVKATQTAKVSMMVSRAAPTPCVDTQGLYVFFESGELLKFSHEGEVQWQRSLTKEYGNFKVGHGIGSSLTQTKDAVIVLIDHEGPSYLLAVNKKTGKNLWKTERKSRISWTSPVIASRNGKSEVIVSSNGSVDSYDAETGKSLWSIEDVSGNTVASATVHGDLIVLGASPSRTNPNSGSAARSNCCLRLIEKEGKRSVEVLWRAKKATSSFATPLIHGQCVYFVNKVGALYCLDLKTGKQNYVQRLSGSCWASPLGVGERIYFFGKDGVSTVVQAGPEYKQIAKNELWTQEKETSVKEKQTTQQQPRGRGSYGGSLDPVVYGVAVVERGLIFRTGTKLIRVGQ